MIDVKATLSESEERMEMAALFLEDALAKIRAGRANVAIVSGVKVDSYGSMVPLNQVANVSVPDARTIAIRPWDKKMIRTIEKAIMDSDVGITPENNGEIIRLAIPQPTEERRRDLTKQCNKIAEKAKVEVRNVRADIKEKLKKAIKDGLSEDNEKDAENDLQKLHDKNTGSWYTVLTDDGETVESKIKGNFRLKGIRSTNPVAVGDRVGIVRNQEGTAFINEIDDRRNYIIRKSPNLSKQSHIIAANVDQAVLIATVNFPVTSTTFIDRFLASAEAYRIPVVLVLNKTDLMDEDDLRLQEMMATLYENIGYTCLQVSAETGMGLDQLKALLKDKISVFSGNSGVGKSTLLNRLIPGLSLRTAEISEAHKMGMHTTTFSEMIRLPEGGWVIDTPGIKGFGTFDMEPGEISGYFREIFHFSKDCKYGNCTHTHEPGCAVLKAVEDHYIAASRYNSYVSMLDDKDESKYREAF